MIEFEIHGTPRPQGSKTGVRRGDRAVVIEAGTTRSRAAFHAWRAAVALHASLHAPDPPLDGPLALSATFWLERPASAAKRAHPHVKPDLDKLARSLCDGLTAGGLIHDDARIVRMAVEKSYGPAPSGMPSGATVRVGRIEQG